MDEALKVRWIGPHFFFSFELSYQRDPSKAVWAGLRGWWSGTHKTPCSPRIHCAEWSCVVLNDSPRRHNGAGRDRPDKSPSVYPNRPVVCGIGPLRPALRNWPTRAECRLYRVGPRRPATQANVEKWHSRNRPPFPSHTFLNYLFALISSIYRSENLISSFPAAIPEIGDAYPTQTPQPSRALRLRHFPPHCLSRRPLHCRRRARFHDRSRPALRLSHIPHPLPRLSPVVLRPMPLRLRHHSHHPGLQRHPPLPRLPGRPRSRRPAAFASPTASISAVPPPLPKRSSSTSPIPRASSSKSLPMAGR